MIVWAWGVYPTCLILSDKYGKLEKIGELLNAQVLTALESRS